MTKNITLLTDFGLKGSPVAVMKGVIYSILPEVMITDISHAISPQNILEGATTLGWVTPYFPADTIHIAVVDPGVGTARRPIAARIGRHYFVGPDNGLFTLLLEAAEKTCAPVEIVHLDKPEYWLPEVSSTFHGRDVFAPTGAHLAKGVPLTELGSLIHDPVRLKIPTAEKKPYGWYTEVVNIDNFGNLYTSLPKESIAGARSIRVKIARQEINGLVRTFGDSQPGELVALIDSTEHLSISIVNGSAAKVLNVTLGEPVEVILE